MSDVLIRNAVASDLNFIRRTWLSGLMEFPSGLPKIIWDRAHREYVEGQLADPDNAVLIAAASDNTHEILGWVVARPDARLEWVHVRKGNVRGMGLAGLLLRAARTPDPAPVRWRDRSNRLRTKYAPRKLA